LGGGCNAREREIKPKLTASHTTSSSRCGEMMTPAACRFGVAHLLRGGHGACAYQGIGKCVCQDLKGFSEGRVN
jgi:hypothetical protein